MLTIRKSQDRGYADHGWLRTHHTFSFAGYYDPGRIHFGALRVLNDDTVAAGMGFGTHPHDNMEIISYVVDGALTHADSMGNQRSLTRGQVQYMSAGTGVMHSEFNHAKGETTHLLQIWIMPNVKNATPGYQQKTFSSDVRNQ